MSSHSLFAFFSGVKDYLGEKIGLYFALLGHYTAWLGPLSIMGLIVSVDQIMESNIDCYLAPYFSVFVSLWAVSLLCAVVAQYNVYYVFN